jgi:hypothetical protein
VPESLTLASSQAGPRDPAEFSWTLLVAADEVIE